MKKMFNEIAIEITAKRASVQKVEFEAKSQKIADFIHQFESIDRLDLKNLVDFNSTISAIATFDCSKFESNRLTYQNGAPKRLIPALKEILSNDINEALRAISWHAFDGYSKAIRDEENAAVEAEIKAFEEKPENIQKKINSINEKIEALLKEKAELEAKLAAKSEPAAEPVEIVESEPVDETEIVERIEDVTERIQEYKEGIENLDKLVSTKLAYDATVEAAAWNKASFEAKLEFSYKELESLRTRGESESIDDVDFSEIIQEKFQKLRNDFCNPKSEFDSVIVITTADPDLRLIEYKIKSKVIDGIQEMFNSLDDTAKSKINLDAVIDSLGKYDFTGIECSYLVEIPFQMLGLHVQEKVTREIQDFYFGSDEYRAFRIFVANPTISPAKLISANQSIEISITTKNPAIQEIEVDKKTEFIECIQTDFEKLDDNSKLEINLDEVIEKIASFNFAAEERFKLGILKSRSGGNKLGRVTEFKKASFRLAIESALLNIKNRFFKQIQKNDGNSTADKKTTSTTSTPADNNPATMVILNNPNENLSKVFRIDTDEQRQKCINALYDYLEIFLIDTFDDETFEPAGIGLDPAEIVTSIEMMIEDNDPEYLNELLQSNGITLQIR